MLKFSAKMDKGFAHFISVPQVEDTNVKHISEFSNYVRVVEHCPPPEKFSVGPNPLQFRTSVVGANTPSVDEKNLPRC